jgi:HAD superfamily hydrolase (TIGR01509 family)
MATTTYTGPARSVGPDRRCGRDARSMLELPGEGERLMDELHELVMNEALAGVAPRPGALDLVERLRDARVPIAVASNSQREFVERTLASAGPLDGRFQAVVSAEDVERPKPAPDIYLEACRRLSAEPGRCAAVEDSPTGVAAAVAAGMYVIGGPLFTGAQLPECDLLAGSLADSEVSRVLGVG